MRAPLHLLLPFLAVALFAIAAGLTVVLQSPRPAPILLADRVIAPGETIEITGTGFEAGEAILLTWNGSLVEWLPPLETNLDGGFEVEVLVPESVGEGEGSIAAATENSGVATSAPITVLDTEGDVAREPFDISRSFFSPEPLETPDPDRIVDATTEPTPEPTDDVVAATAPSLNAPSAAATAVPGSGSSAGAHPPVNTTIGGYGGATVGGAGGKTIAVTNLSDSGPGSLRAALETSGPRVVVFAVGGLISLSSDIKISNPNLTIAGETAPAPVVVRGGATIIRASEVIVRHVRFRPGDDVGSPSDVDALTINGMSGPVRNVVIDHVTMIWGPDIGGLAILGDVENVSVTNSIMGEGLYLSGHAEANKSEGGHSHAANITQMDGGSRPPRRLTFAFNLFTTSDTRIPRLQGAECVDIVNNVIYNWGKHAAHGNPVSLNLVNNWYRSGPETTTNQIWAPQTSSVASKLNSNAVYEAGNRADGFSAVRGGDASLYASGPLCGGLSVGAVGADAAYGAVLSRAGATAPVRDVVDARIIGNVQSRSGAFVNGIGQPAPNPYWP